MLDIEVNKKLLTTCVVVVGAAAVGVLITLWRKKAKLIALDPTKKIPFRLIEKEVVSHDTRRFRFALQTPDHILGLPIGQHMYLSARVNGLLVVRAYTPVTSDDEVGYFDLVIKVYFKNVNPRFPDGGKMSQHLEAMELGDTIDVRGPNGHLQYLGRGKFQVEEKKKSTRVMSGKKVGMIAGGTGITPMLQLIKAILKDKQDTTQMWLLYANQTEEDILLRNELETIQKENPHRFSLWYTLDRPHEDWSYSTGFVCESMITEHLPACDKDSVVLMCGPPPMITYACLPNLQKLGFKEEQYFAY